MARDMCGLDSVARTGVDVLLSWTFRRHGFFLLGSSSSAPSCQVKLEYCTYIRTSLCALGHVLHLHSPGGASGSEDAWPSRPPQRRDTSLVIIDHTIRIGTGSCGRGPYSRMQVS